MTLKKDILLLLFWDGMNTSGLPWVSSHEQIVAANRILATRGLEKLGGITAMDATGLVEMLKPPKFSWDIFLNPSI
jgi:hypothetical protein